MIIIYIVCKDKEEAKKISRHLLGLRLAACANMFPIESSYWWEGKIEDAQEVVLLVKTLKRNFEKIKREVKNLHSYQIPCIFSLKAHRTDKSYYHWLKKEALGFKKPSKKV
ncbi:MAG: divalent-cation tolerance protein CutA [Candidatus Magasanikbacteria bacterium]|nr:divalent-cation tolerance protein CutA [Candidatus Magasanikbacteria bacterium]